MSIPTFSNETFRRDQTFGAPLPEGWLLFGGVAARSEQFQSEALSILENVSEGVYGLDMNGYVTFTNPAAQRMTGWSLQDLQGRTQHSLVHHSHADGSEYKRDECPIHRAFQEGITQRRDDEVFWRKDGSSFPVSYTSTPIFRDGAPVGAVVVFTDVSEAILRRRWETSVRDLLLALITQVPLQQAWPPMARAFAGYQRGYTLSLEVHPRFESLLPGFSGAVETAAGETARVLDLLVEDPGGDGLSEEDPGEEGLREDAAGVEEAPAARLVLTGPEIPLRLNAAVGCLDEERETLQGALRLALRNAMEASNTWTAL